MKSLLVYIVEDEPLITVNIKFALKKKGIRVAGHSSTYDDALEGISKIQPNLVLLDILLDENKDGVDLALWLEEQSIPYLYITSQTDPNTLARVKETNPLGYVVKPFTEAGLLSNIELAWHKIQENSDDYLKIKSEGRNYQLNQGAILYLKAFDNYCYVVTSSQEYLVPHTLKKTAEQLNQEFFVQTHRSYWVNLRKITALTADSVVIGDTEIPISYSRRNDIRQLLES